MPELTDLRPIGDDAWLFSWQDGHRSLMESFYLRLECPCAGCIDEYTGRRTLKPETLPKDVRALAVEPVGRYGLKFRWSDGHQTGIYSFDFLRSLCVCDPCLAPKKAHHEAP